MFRRIIRNRSQQIVVVLLLALSFGAAIPKGMMLNSGESGFSFYFCSSDPGSSSLLDIIAEASDSETVHDTHNLCVFNVVAEELNHSAYPGLLGRKNEQTFTQPFQVFSVRGLGSHHARAPPTYLS